MRRAPKSNVASESSIPEAAAAAAAAEESNDAVVRHLLEALPSAALLQHRPVMAEVSLPARCFEGIFDSAPAKPSSSSQSAPRRLQASGAEMHGHRGDHAWPAPLLVVESNVVSRPVCESLCFYYSHPIRFISLALIIVHFFRPRTVFGTAGL